MRHFETSSWGPWTLVWHRPYGWLECNTWGVGVRERPPLGKNLWNWPWKSVILEKTTALSKSWRRPLWHMVISTHHTSILPLVCHFGRRHYVHWSQCTTLNNRRYRHEDHVYPSWCSLYTGACELWRGLRSSSSSLKVEGPQMKMAWAILLLRCHHQAVEHLKLH
jgi:hypothetical protein